MFRKENFTEIYDAQKRTHLGEGVTCAVKNRLVRDECIMRSGQQSARLEIEKWLGDKEVKANRRMRSTNWFFRSFEPTSGWTSLSGWNAIGTMKINCLFNNQSWSIQINDGIASDRDPACRVASFSCYPELGKCSYFYFRPISSSFFFILSSACIRYLYQARWGTGIDAWLHAPNKPLNRWHCATPPPQHCSPCPSCSVGSIHSNLRQVGAREPLIQTNCSINAL